MRMRQRLLLPSSLSARFRALEVAGCLMEDASNDGAVDGRQIELVGVRVVRTQGQEHFSITVSYMMASIRIMAERPSLNGHL